MRIALVAALVVIASCGGDGAVAPYSCRAVVPGSDTLALCIDASGGSAQDRSNNRQQCTTQGNMFSEEPCPHAGALGGCRETSTVSDGVFTTWYYADGTATAADIQMLCEGLAGVAPSIIKIEFVVP
jgi:hypothetical protein